MIERRLKHINDIIDSGPGNWHSFDTDEYTNEKMDWHINDDMSQRFGDGKLYIFEEYTSCYEYTHEGDDGYLYHSSWFDEKEPEAILKLDDGDFLI